MSSLRLVLHIILQQNVFAQLYYTNLMLCVSVSLITEVHHGEFVVVLVLNYSTPNTKPARPTASLDG